VLSAVSLETALVDSDVKGVLETSLAKSQELAGILPIIYFIYELNALYSEIWNIGIGLFEFGT
jgi:hypothetical protein